MGGENRAGFGHHMTGAPILHLGGEVVCEPLVLSSIWWYDEQLLSISPLTVRLDTTCVWSYFALVTGGPHELLLRGYFAPSPYHVPVACGGLSFLSSLWQL